MPSCVTTPSAALGPAGASSLNALIDAGGAAAATIPARQVIRHAGCVGFNSHSPCPSKYRRLLAAEEGMGRAFDLERAHREHLGRIGREGSATEGRHETLCLEHKSVWGASAVARSAW